MMISPNVIDRWRPMWYPGAHPERPWWRWVQAYGSNPHTGEFRAGAYYVRACGTQVWAPELGQDSNGILYDSAALEAYDREHPLPVPPPMPGQVWVHVESGEETLIRAVAGEAASRNTSAPGAEWPPPGGILVAGPTPWGRDVPWMDTR